MMKQATDRKKDMNKQTTNNVELGTEKEV
jgi:hypothetical protein